MTVGLAISALRSLGRYSAIHMRAVERHYLLGVPGSSTHVQASLWPDGYEGLPPQQHLMYIHGYGVR